MGKSKESKNREVYIACSEFLKALVHLLKVIPEGEYQKISQNSEERIPISEVRQVLAEKCVMGHTKEVKQILAKYRAEKLSEVNPRDYKDLLDDIKNIEKLFV